MDEPKADFALRLQDNPCLVIAKIQLPQLEFDCIHGLSIILHLGSIVFQLLSEQTRLLNSRFLKMW